MGRIIIDKGGFWSVVTDKDLQRSGGTMMRNTQIVITLVVLCVVDAVVPFFPVLGLVLIYVVAEKPSWFLEAVRHVYETR